MSETPRKPPRPALPVSLYVLVTVVTAERVVLRAGLRGKALLWIVAGSAIVCLVAAVALRKGGLGGVTPTLFAAWVALVAGAGLAGIAYAEGTSLETALESRSVSSFEFEVTGEMSEGRDGWRGRALARGEGIPEGSVWILTDEEIQKAKNKGEAAFVRSLTSTSGLASRVGRAELKRGWRSILTDLEDLKKVTNDDIKRVAAKYFVKDNSLTAIYTRKTGR